MNFINRVGILLSLVLISESFSPGQRWVARRFAIVNSEVTTDALVATEKLSIESLVVDSEMTGTVKRISDFGAFIDFGCKSDGLVHKSQLSDSFVSNPAEVVKVGQQVSVRILRVDLEKGQVSLTMKSKGTTEAPKVQRTARARTPTADYSKYEQVDEKQTFEGTVRNVMAFGAFVDLEDGATGLVHISQLTEGRTENTQDVVKVGDKVSVRVISFENGKLSLTMRPWSESSNDSQSQGEKGEGSGRRSRGGNSRGNSEDDDDGLNSRNRIPKVEDIWSDNTEPKWQELVNAKIAEVGEFNNLLEFELAV